MLYPALDVGLHGLDFGEVITPDGRAHPVTALTPVTTSLASSSDAAQVTVSPVGTMLNTGPNFAPSSLPTGNPAGGNTGTGGVVTPGGGSTGGTPSTENIGAAIVNGIIAGLQGNGGLGSGSAATAAVQNTLTGGSTPLNLGPRLILATIGIGIVLLVVGRFVLKD